MTNRTSYWMAIGQFDLLRTYYGDNYKVGFGKSKHINVNHFNKYTVVIVFFLRIMNY